LIDNRIFKAKRKTSDAKSLGAAAISWGTSAPTTTTTTTTTAVPPTTDEKAGASDATSTTTDATTKVAPPPEKKTKKDEKEDTTSSTTTATASNGFSDAFAKFRAKPGEWECPHCLVRNAVGVLKCRACEMDRDAPATKAPAVIPQATADKSDAEKAAADKAASIFGGAGLTKTLSGTAPETSGMHLSR
jgi:hypothetical protein